MPEATIHQLSGELLPAEECTLCDIGSWRATLAVETRPTKLVNAGRLFSDKVKIELHVIEPPVGTSQS